MRGEWNTCANVKKHSQETSSATARGDNRLIRTAKSQTHAVLGGVAGAVRGAADVSSVDTREDLVDALEAMVLSKGEVEL